MIRYAAPVWVRATVVVALVLATMVAASASEDIGPEEVPLDDTEFADVLQRRLPDIDINRIERSPIEGLHAVEIDNGVTLYVTEDGSYAIAGVLYALTEEGPVDPSQASRAATRRALLADVSMDQMIVFAPEGEPRLVLDVFTDTDCGFCRKLHAEVAELNAYGIEVRYLAFPRAGIGSETYDNMVSAWCADDPRDAITRLKRGNKIPSKTCDNPVAEQYEIGRLVGIQGTPTIIAPDGELIGGYVPAAELAEGLGLQ
jgi:thiol:disulfide interchange protein DsbC